MQQKDCSLLIIIESYRGAELLGVYFKEFMQESNLQVAAIQASGFGDARCGFMADINIYTSAEIITNNLIQLGQAESAMVSEKSTILCGGTGSDKAINAQIDKTRSDLNQSTSELDKERYRQRVNRLLGVAEEDIPEKASADEWEIYVSETMQKLLNSAPQGDSNAKLKLGLFYLWCDGIQNDSAQAERWIKDSAKQGNLNAQMFLGIFYAYGDRHWKIKNAAEAKKWVNQAIKQHDCQMTKFFLEQIEGKI